MPSGDAVGGRTRGDAALERRAGPDSAPLLRALRRVRGLFLRPLALEWRGMQLHLVLRERRHAGEPDPRPSANELREELRSLMRVRGREHARLHLRHLLLVYRELGRDGWHSVGALPSEVLRRALLQAEELSGDRPSRRMDFLLDRLHALKTSADRRDLNRRLQEQSDLPPLEVSDATPEDFEQSERSWFGDLPPPQQPPARQ